MKQEILDAIVERSEQYTKNLWTRFVNNLPVDDIEQRIFSKLKQIAEKHHLDLSDASPLNATTLMSASEKDGLFLPWTFFYPGTTSNVFINNHLSLMNNHIIMNGFFELIYVCRGEIINWADGREILLKEGELCIHNLNTKHQIVKMDDTKDFVLNIYLPPDMFQKTLYFLLYENRDLYHFFNCIVSANNPNVLVFKNPSNHVDMLLELLIREYLQNENASNYIMESTLVVLFGELMRNYDIDTFSNEIVNYLSEHLDHATLYETAAHFGYHKNYFPSLIKRHTGQSFNELVTTMRIQRSISLLLFSDYPIEEISNMIGYKSTASFYTHFKKSHGITPTEYRSVYKNTEKRPSLLFPC